MEPRPRTSPLHVRERPRNAPRLNVGGRDDQARARTHMRTESAAENRSTTHSRGTSGGIAGRHRCCIAGHARNNICVARTVESSHAPLRTRGSWNGSASRCMVRWHYGRKLPLTVIIRMNCRVALFSRELSNGFVEDHSLPLRSRRIPLATPIGVRKPQIATWAGPSGVARHSSTLRRESG